MEQKKIAIIIILTGLIIAGFIFYRKSTPETTAKPLSIPFTYEVVSVGAQEAVLRGDKGEVTVSNQVSTKVFRGTPQNASNASFSDLKSGQKVKVDVIPGKEAKLYIIE